MEPLSANCAFVYPENALKTSKLPDFSCFGVNWNEISPNWDSVDSCKSWYVNCE